MHKGPQRFEFYLLQLETLISKAAKQKNPALFLYSNNARTPLFMLEGLAKLYGGLHNSKRFAKIKEHFKLLEDALGAIDYYDSIAKNLAGNKKIPAEIIQYLQAQTREKIQRLNELLEEKGWTGTDPLNRIIKIRKKLAGADWLDDKHEIKEMEVFYGVAIYDIVAFVNELEFQFKNMEADVHELRRKLRWLSIYPQALQGAIQLAQAKTTPRQLSKYLTPEIVNSPFNKMPEAGDNTCFLLLSKNYFLALSWMIAELGKLKDSGLQIIAIKEALAQTEETNEAAALKKIYKMLGAKQPPIETLLANAAAISKTYFKEHNLENMVIGASVPGK